MRSRVAPVSPLNPVYLTVFYTWSVCGQMQAKPYMQATHAHARTCTRTHSQKEPDDLQTVFK